MPERTPGFPTGLSPFAPAWFYAFGLILVLAMFVFVLALWATLRLAFADRIARWVKLALIPLVDLACAAALWFLIGRVLVQLPPH
jgi:hypothetical protein